MVFLWFSLRFLSIHCPGGRLVTRSPQKSKIASRSWHCFGAVWKASNTSKKTSWTFHISKKTTMDFGVFFWIWKVHKKMGQIQPATFSASLVVRHQPSANPGLEETHHPNNDQTLGVVSNLGPKSDPQNHHGLLWISMDFYGFLITSPSQTSHEPLGTPPWPHARRRLGGVVVSLDDTILDVSWWWTVLTDTALHLVTMEPEYHMGRHGTRHAPNFRRCPKYV